MEHEPVLTNLRKYVEYTLGVFGDSQGHALVAVALHFNEGVLVIEVDPEDDTVDIRLGSEADLLHSPGTTESDRSFEPQWSPLLGFNCAWRWVFTNQQGYRDGAQVELSHDGQHFGFQWIAAASSLLAAEVIQR
jgi:hypothetical protein